MHCVLQDAMEEVRSLLPEVVHQQLIAGGEQGLTEQTLRRWTVARKMNARLAAADLTAHAAWRAAWAPQGRILEAEIGADLQQDKLFLQGTDKQGRGIIILQARKHTLSESSAQQRYICYVLDGAIALANTASNPDAKVVAIFELLGISLANCDAVGLKNIFSLLNSHYVERLSTLYMRGAPSIFWGLWSVVSPFIDPVTRKKVVFVAAGDNQTLLDACGPEVLPPHLGGTAALVPAQVAWERILQQRAEQQQQQSVAPAGQLHKQGTAAAGKTGHEQQHVAAALCGAGAASMCGQEQAVLPGLPGGRQLHADDTGGVDAAVVVGSG